MINSYHLEGIIAFDNHEYKKAQELFLQAIEKNPETPENYHFLGKSYFLCDEKHEAIVPLMTFIKLKQDHLDDVTNLSHAFDLLAQCYEAENNDTAAQKYYETATKINPSCATAWHNMGLLYIKSAQNYLEQDLTHSFRMFRNAQCFLKNAVEICSDNPVFLHSVACWYEKYIEALEKLTEEEQTVQETISNNFKFAIQYYRKALATCGEKDLVLKNIFLSNLTECLAQCGHHLYRSENYIGAQKFYLEAIKLDPNHLTAINQMGMSLFKQNHFAEARKYFSDILGKTEDKQEHADAWLNIACAYRLEKTWVEAEKSLNEAKKLAPEDTSIFEEEEKLVESKLQAILITTPQTLFGNTNHVSRNIENTATQSSTIQLN